MAVKYVFKVTTQLTDHEGKPFDTFNVAASSFEAAVHKAEEEIASDATPGDDYTENIISVTRTSKLGRERT